MEGEPALQFYALDPRPASAGYLVTLIKTFKRKVHPAASGVCPPVQGQIHRAEMKFSAPARIESDVAR